jgi:hypothetical protein
MRALVPGTLVCFIAIAALGFLKVAVKVNSIRGFAPIPQILRAKC